LQGGAPSHNLNVTADASASALGEAHFNVTADASASALGEAHFNLGDRRYLKSTTKPAQTVHFHCVSFNVHDSQTLS
jgi:hypothetical protein